MKFREFLESKNNLNIVDFFIKRKSGAKDIAEDSANQGTTPAKLTEWHFDAKSIPYKECIDAIKNGKDSNFFKEKCESLKNYLKFEKNLTQKEFQELMGVLEVWGEVFCRIKEEENT